MAELYFPNKHESLDIIVDAGGDAIVITMLTMQHDGDGDGEAVV